MKSLSYIFGATQFVSGAIFLAMLAGCGGGSVGAVASNTGESLSCVARQPGASVAELLAAAI